MKDWPSILCTGLSLLVCYLCFAYTDKVIRGMCLLVAIFFGFLTFCFFERIKLGDAFLQSHTGKAGFPGSIRACIGCGMFTLLGAAIFIYWGIWH
ncbi:MAG: hypothetical protein P4N60_06460 [Verrucomicrobiae bacterium]|nr:hypothetical protein [Verrucomicrobiae bacterium]